MRYQYILLVVVLSLSCGEKKKSDNIMEEESVEKVKLMTLDPGHFHAALVHKTMYPNVDPTLFVFAPEGPEVQDFFDKIEAYNTRPDNPTRWETNPYFGEDFLKQMITEKPGDVMIIAGKNSKKIDYVLEAVKAGLNVYADKPLVINPEGFEKLKEAFQIAKQNDVLIYDIMTERFESTTLAQKLFSQMPNIFGELVEGSPENPAIVKKSIHHFFKYVSEQPLVRPPWFFDVNEEGEGIVDVTTHLVDLVQWEAFPEQIIDTSDIEILSAKRWPTVLTLDEFQKVTRLESFPGYLQKDIKANHLEVYSNGEINYKIKGKHAKVSVIWNYQAPEGTADTHYSIMRGSISDLIIKQGEAESYKPTLYIKFHEKSSFKGLISSGIENEVEKQFPGITLEKIANDLWKVKIPEKFKIGHEAHFSQVTENYLEYLESGKLPDWEVPNMIAKYYTTIGGYKMSKSK